MPGGGPISRPLSDTSSTEAVQWQQYGRGKETADADFVTDEAPESMWGGFATFGFILVLIGAEFSISTTSAAGGFFVLATLLIIFGSSVAAWFGGATYFFGVMGGAAVSIVIGIRQWVSPDPSASFRWMGMVGLLLVGVAVIVLGVVRYLQIQLSIEED